MAKIWRPQVPLFEQVNIMKQKIQLMDGDRKAYYDATFQKLLNEHKKLTELRAQVKSLRQDLGERCHPDEFITDQALQRHTKERQSMLRFSANEAIEIMDCQVNDSLKKLNFLRYKTELKKDKLHDLEERYTRLLIHASDEEDIKIRQGTVGRQLRDLENRLDKAILKQNEAHHVNATYMQIRDLLKQEAVTYNITAEAIEYELIKSKDEMKQVKVLYNDAILVRNHDLIELRRHEEFITTEMKRRELELGNMKKLVQQRNFNSIHSKVVVPMEMSFGDQEELSNKTETNSILVDENNIRLKKHENLFQMIKQVTGLSNLHEMAKRFQTQVNLTNSLTNLKNKLEQDLSVRKLEKEATVSDFLEQRFNIEDRTSKHNIISIEKENKINLMKKSVDDITKSLLEKELLLSKIRFSINHISSKCDKKADKVSDLNDVKMYNKAFDKIMNEIILYIHEMKDYNLTEESFKLMEEVNEVVLIPSELNVIIESKLSSSNTRIKLNIPLPKDALVADEDTDPDEKIDVITRETLKKQSRKIIEAKVKKRVNVISGP